MAHNFGAVGLSEVRNFSFVVKPFTGAPAVTSIEVQEANGIEVLSADAVSERGGVPCSGIIDRFCVVMVRVRADALGSKSASFVLHLSDLATPGIFETVGPFLVTATVQSSPTSARNEFRTVSIRAKAQAAGVSPLQYLTEQYNRIKPTAFRVDTTDIHSSAVSDALLFDAYGSPWSPVNWRNNWLNSVFDFSTSSMDTFGGTAPDYLGPYSQGGVAITRCHIATAKHYPRGGGFMFHSRTGEPQWFPIAASASTPSYDITVYRINPCLPAEFPVYALLDSDDVASGINLVGAPYLGNHFNVIDYVRRGSILQIGYVSGTAIGGTGTTLSPSSMQVFAQSGDSGSPTFIYAEGELVLLSTYTYGGWGSGPFYGAPAVQAELRAALSSIPAPD